MRWFARGSARFVTLSPLALVWAVACGGGDKSGVSSVGGASGVAGDSAGSGGSGSTNGVAGASGSAGLAGTSGASAAGGSAGSSGASGSAGVAGTNSTGGTAGLAGSAGIVGTGGDGGSGGEGGTGGAAGSAGSAGSTGGCADVSECPGEDTACSARSCEAGQCGFSFLAVGTPISTQVEGDCRSAQCDGHGAEIAVNDDSDLPDDQNPCTHDLCANGIASHSSVSEGQSCGGALICDGHGVCTGCVTPSDCPGQDNQCRTRTCVQGMCNVLYTANGTALSNAFQSPGDCKTAQCNGQGAIVSVSTVSDIPVDGNDCTRDVCTGSIPSNPPSVSGTSCTSSGGSVCNGAGACLECVLASDCTPPPGECQVSICIGGTCGMNNVAAGVVTQAQTVGDCHQNQCDGHGGISPVPFDADAPDDNNVCTADSCADGRVSHDPVTPGTTCGAALVCDSTGHCVGCASAADCGVDSTCRSYTCDAGACTVHDISDGIATPPATQTDGDCHTQRCDGAGSIVNRIDDQDAPVDNNPCSDDVCTGGTPSNPISVAGTGCSSNGGTVCDGAGSCVPCNVTADCPSNAACANHQCFAVVCGDGFVTGLEECDDGNTLDADGCTSTCTLEPGFSCVGEPSVCTAL